MALFTAVILDCFSVINHVDSAVVNLDALKLYKATWANFDPFATGYIPLCMLQRFVQELGKPLGFNTYREKMHWRELYLQCLALHEEHADSDEAMRMVEFNKLLELLAVQPFGKYLKDSDAHLDYKDKMHQQALIMRLKQDNAADRLAATWRGFLTRKNMPENTAILQARRTLRRREKELKGRSNIVPSPPSRPQASRSIEVTQNPLSKRTESVDQPKPLRRISPIDGTVEWVTKVDATKTEASGNWGRDHGWKDNIVPVAPLSRDAQRAHKRRNENSQVDGDKLHGFYEL